MANIKHIGRAKKSRRKVLVAYRVVPGEAENCLIIPTEALQAEYHDSAMRLVESEVGQSAYELAEAMARVRLPDGRIMLHAFHKEGKLMKVPSASIEMTPNTQTVISLDELNTLIAKQKGVTVADLALGAEQMQKTPALDAHVSAEQAADAYTATAAKPAAQPRLNAVQTPEFVEDAMLVQEQPLSDIDLAKNYRDQAEMLSAEAKRLRAEAKKLEQGSQEA